MKKDFEIEYRDEQIKDLKEALAGTTFPMELKSEYKQQKKEDILVSSLFFL